MLTNTELAVLRKAPLFSSFGDSELELVSRAAKCVELKRRDSLWRHGDAADSMGVLVSGRLVMGRMHQGRDVIVEVVAPGELVGEVGLTHAQHHFDVYCLRKARVLLIPNRVVSRLLELHPRACAALALDLATLVMRLTRRLEALNAGNVEQRLARVVVSLIDRFGEPFPGGVLVPLKLRREDLASLAATTVESTSRRLSAWKAQGVLITQPAGFLVRDQATLRRLVE